MTDESRAAEAKEAADKAKDAKKRASDLKRSEQCKSLRALKRQEKQKAIAESHAGRCR